MFWTCSPWIKRQDDSQILDNNYLNLWIDVVQIWWLLVLNLKIWSASLRHCSNVFFSFLDKVVILWISLPKIMIFNNLLFEIKLFPMIQSSQWNTTNLKDAKRLMQYGYMLPPKLSNMKRTWKKFFQLSS